MLFRGWRNAFASETGVAVYASARSWSWHVGPREAFQTQARAKAPVSSKYLIGGMVWLDNVLVDGMFRSSLSWRRLLTPG